MKKRLSRNAWLEHITECEESGLRTADYCRLHDLSPKTMSYWRSTLKRNKQYTKVVAVPASPSQVEIHHAKSGITIKVPSNANKTTLVEVCEALSCLS